MSAFTYARHAYVCGMAGALFSTPAEVAVSTPATRDRAIDVIRIVSLVGVVVGHTVMAVSTLRGDVFIWSTCSPRRWSSRR